MAQITSMESIADIFGVTPKTIVEWQDAGFPVLQRGGPGVASIYETVACIRWLINREIVKLQMVNPKDRLSIAQAEKIEMENAVTRGALVPVMTIEPMLKTVVITARNKLRNEAGRLSRELATLPPAEIEVVLNMSFDAFLLELSRWPGGAGDSTPLEVVE